jgi:hypothetical protein
MRVATIGFGLLLFTTSASAQVAPCPPLGVNYDPYKPSDLAIMREYGGTILAQAHPSVLLKLDPYVPSQGELLRQLGRGIPLWPAYPGYVHASAPHSPDCAPSPRPSAPEPETASARPLARLADVVAVLEREPTPTSPPVAVSMGPRPTDSNIVVTVQFASRSWVSAGVAVPFRETEFVRVGESGRFSVFRRLGQTDDVIFLPTTGGMVAPFRAMP